MGFNLCEIKLNSNSNSNDTKMPITNVYSFSMKYVCETWRSKRRKTSDLYSEIQHKKCDTKSNQSYYRFSKHKIAVVGRSKNTGSSVPSGRWLRARARRKVNTDRWSCQLLGRIYTTEQNAIIHFTFGHSRIPIGQTVSAPLYGFMLVCVRSCLRLTHASDSRAEK